VSVASIWEVVNKMSIRKLPHNYATGALSLWPKALATRVLPVEPSHLDALYGLPLLHWGPFDRMLVAQAISEDFTLVTPDKALHRYPVKWVW
jgi:PIN domain nuclease of toxin-antitoxin system